MTATSAKIWTINDIQTAMRARGSHWFDPDTMRFFKCRVLSEVYQGEGGIYFVSSEKNGGQPRGYTVRKFDPAALDIDTAGEFNEMTKGRAQRLARKLAGPSVPPVVVDEPYRPVTVLEQFAADVAAHGRTGILGYNICRNLIHLAARHNRLMVQWCNGDIDPFDADGEPTGILKATRDAIQKQADYLGAKSVILGGDPRGCTCKLVFHDGATNDWGKEGWCVPTEL